VNLGIKAIIGLMAASQIATILGDDADATTWSDAATNNVGPWITLSTDAAAGNYLNVAQGATGTWLSLYNAYYELVIGVSLVPDQIAANQAAYYLNSGNLMTYGLPLQTYANNLTKVAWQFYLPAWLGGYTIADEMMSRNVAYINDTPSLVPYGDRYNTTNATEVSPVQAHPTLGAVFALLAAEITPPPETGTTPPAAGTTQTGGTPPTTTPAAAAAVATAPAPVSVKVTATPAPKPTLTISIGDGGLKLSGKNVSVRVHGSKGKPCHGSLKLAYTHEVTLKNHKRKRVTTVIGHASYSLPAGNSRTVKIKLTTAGLKLLRDAKNHRLSVVLTATVVGGMSTSKRTTIHEPVVR
jgi:hypothetical protein